MLNKKAVHLAVLTNLSGRFEQLNAALNDALDATANETKSTAGDKHETGRAMAQLEQEKLSSQISEVNKLKEAISRIDPESQCNSVCPGSLVETSMGFFYISIGIGAVQADGHSVFCMTPIAPLCNVIIGKKAGDVINWQGKEVRIVSVC